MTKEELKNLKEGTIVYYVTSRLREHFADPKGWNVEFGVFDGLSSYRNSDGELVSSGKEGIVLSLEIKDHRWVKTLTSDWTPFDEFESETEMHKLPKKWEYNTPLFWVENRYPCNDITFDLKDRDKITELYKKGWFVELDKNDHRHIEAEFDHDYYKIVKKGTSMMYGNRFAKHLFYTLSCNEIFLDFDEAQETATRRIKLEMETSKRVLHKNCMESLEEHLTFISDADRREKYRKKILSMGAVEDFILRHVDDKILWAYRKDKHKVWNEVVI